MRIGPRRTAPPHVPLAAGFLLAPAGWWLVGRHAPPAGGAWGIACALLVYPVLEELCFRGGLQPALAARRLGQVRIGGISVANLLTSLLFAAVHLPTRPLAWAAAIVLPSLLLGAVRERYGRVAPAIGLHAWFNAGPALAAMLAR